MLYCDLTELIAQNLVLVVSFSWQYLSGDRNTQNPTGPNIDTRIQSSLIFEPALYSDEQIYSCTALALMAYNDGTKAFGIMNNTLIESYFLYSSFTL